MSSKEYYELGDNMVYIDYLGNGAITMFIISSTWLIVVMAAERYIAVCHPLRARKLISLRRTRASIVLVLVCCALASIPKFMEKRIEEVRCTANLTNGVEPRTVLMVTQARSEHWVTLRRIIWALGFDFVPCAALVYFNLCLIVQIRRAKRLREQMTTPQRTSLLHYKAGSTATHTAAMSHNSGVRNKGEDGVLRGGAERLTVGGKLVGAKFTSNTSLGNVAETQATRGGKQGRSGVKYARYVSFVNGKGGSNVRGACSCEFGADLTLDSIGNSRSSHSDTESRQYCENGTNATNTGCNRCGSGGGIKKQKKWRNMPAFSTTSSTVENSASSSSRSSGTSNNNHSSMSSRQNRRARVVIHSNGGGNSIMGGPSSGRGKRPSDSALNSVTATLVAVVLLFLVLVSPSELLKFSIAYMGADPCHEQIVQNITNFMQALNFSLNFLLYCAVNKTFRDTLRGLVCCCWLTIVG